MRDRQAAQPTAQHCCGGWEEGGRAWQPGEVGPASLQASRILTGPDDEEKTGLNGSWCTQCVFWARPEMKKGPLYKVPERISDGQVQKLDRMEQRQEV